MTTAVAETNAAARRRNTKPSTADASAEATLASVRARRSFGWIFGGAAIVVLGCLTSVFAVTSASHTEQVWSVTTAVPRGTTITTHDLGTLSIGEGQTTTALPFSQTTSPVGKIATVDLPKGSILTSQSITSSLGVPQGKALVGLALKPAQLPAQPLNAGDHIKIVQVATNTGTSTNGSTTPAPQSISAVVSDTLQGGSSQAAASSNSTTTVVDVLVNETLASNLTSLAASGQVAVYLVSSEG